MGKLFGLVIVFGTALISLFVFAHPGQPVEQPVGVLAAPQPDTAVVDPHIVAACENAVSSYMGMFDGTQTAIDSCIKILRRHYDHLGTWPGPQLDGNTNSAAYLTAEEVAKTWSGLDFTSASITYRTENARNALMDTMKIERELLEQGN